MNRNLLLLALLFVGVTLKLSAQGTAFNYQGRLNDSGSPANGVYDLRFALYDASTNGNLISGPLTNYAATVSGGLFTTTVDFGSAFTGTNYWLSLGVRTNTTIPSTNAFTLILPRQPLLPVPYAIFATGASNLLGTLSATQLVGTLPSAQIAGNYFGAVNFTNGNNAFLGTFTGNGLNVSNLNGSLIATGTVADARLSTNVALLNNNQTFSGGNVFNNATNSFTGSFFGNGLVGWIPIPSNTVQAVRDTGYLLLSTNVTTVTLPTTSALLVGDIIRISSAGSGGWRVAQNAGEVISGTFLNPSNSSWLPANVASQPWRAIACSADGVKMVASASSAGGTYVSTDYGRTWSQSSATFSPTCLASSADGTKLFGGIAGGGIIFSWNSGSSWYLSDAPTTNWSGIACSANGSNIVAVVNNGRIYTSSNTGTNWTLQANSTFANWFSVACSTDGKKIIAANYGSGLSGAKLSTSTDSGVSWTAQANSDTTNWTAVASSADGTKLAAAAYGNGTSGGRIYTSSDSGVNWTKQLSAPSANWYGLVSSYDGGRLAAITNPTNSIYISANYGLNWTKQSVDNQNWYAIAASLDLTTIAAVTADAGSTGGQIFNWTPAVQGTSTTVGTAGSVTGSSGSAVELQYVGPDATGNARFMPIGGIGTFWAN